MAVVVTGMRELQVAFSKLERDTRLELRHGLHDAAEPVAQTAERLSSTVSKGMRRSPKWAETRIGVTRNLVYVVPKLKGFHGRNPHPKQADAFLKLIMIGSFRPALAQNEGEVVRRVEKTMDKVCEEFNRA